MLELLIYGIEDDKKKIKKMMDKLQSQMSELKKGKYCRILWYIDKGEKTDEEKKQWLIDNSNSKYYVFTPITYLVKPKYVSELLIEIRKYETAIKKMKECKIVPTKKKNV